MAELSTHEQEAIGQLLAELQELPPAAISPQLEGRLQSLSQVQPTPSNPLKLLLKLMAAGVATAGALLAWQFSGLELKVAQKELFCYTWTKTVGCMWWRLVAVELIGGSGVNWWPRAAPPIGRICRKRVHTTK